MKRVVSLDDLTTLEIGPAQLYNSYVVLLEEDLKQISQKNSLVDVPCPGCGSKENKFHCLKAGMQYKSCLTCASLYVSPRLSEDCLDEFYLNANACKYWRREILNYNEPQYGRIHSPRLNWILELLDEFYPQASTFLDYQSKYPHFLKRIASTNQFKKIILKNSYLFEQETLLPPERLDRDEKKRFIGQVDIFTAFEAVERVFSPKKLLESASEYCREGGLLLLTTASSSGFEYKVLGANATNLNPINRMNLLSVERLVKLVDEAGFEIIELSTPGRLDVEIVREKVVASPDLDVDSFWRYVFTERNQDAWNSLQEFLQLNRLSAHVRIAARKKK